LTTTNPIETERLRYNEILKIALLEILGETQAQNLLGQSRNIRISPSNLHLKLEKTYGNPQNKGIEHRVGQACFRYYLQRMGSEIGLFQPSYKLLPVKQKVLTGLLTMSGVYERIFNDKIHFSEDESGYQLQIGSEKSVPEPVEYYGCDITNGFIKEFLSWVGSGKIYEVNEKECRTNGHDHCIYHISKVPLD
jgi:hypothetical protein